MPNEIEQYLADGTYLDLMRVYADGSASNGYLLDQRVVNDGEIAASASLSGGIWTVVFSRPLNSGAPGDLYRWSPARPIRSALRSTTTLPQRGSTM